MSSKLSRNLIFIFKEFGAESWSPEPEGYFPNFFLSGYFVYSPLDTSDSADQLSRFGLDSQGIDHFVKGKKMKNMVMSRKISQEKYNCQGIKIKVQ